MFKIGGNGKCKYGFDLYFGFLDVNLNIIVVFPILRGDFLVFSVVMLPRSISNLNVSAKLKSYLNSRTAKSDDTLPAVSNLTGVEDQRSAASA